MLGRGSFEWVFSKGCKYFGIIKFSEPLFISKISEDEQLFRDSWLDFIEFD